jgi:hypothetical protein
MDYAKTLVDINSVWETTRASLSKEDIAFVSNRDNLRNKMVGFMTSGYYKRNKLILSSEVYYAYVFQQWSNDSSGNELRYPTWLLFSPALPFRSNPVAYKEISAKIQSIKEIEVSAPSEKRLKSLVSEPLSDVSYFEIPAEYSFGQLCYLSIVYRQISIVPEFRLGINLVLANKSVSDEILYFPAKYWSAEFKDAYLAGTLEKKEMTQNG